MKKLFGVITSAVMLAGGAVALAPSPAQAACPYGGCIATNTFIDPPSGGKDGKVRVGDTPKVCVHVGTDGNGEPKGTVTITVVRGKGGYEYTSSRKYNDWNECFELAAVGPKGEYIIKARFDKKPGSRWKDSDNRADFQVYRAKS